MRSSIKCSGYSKTKSGSFSFSTLIFTFSVFSQSDLGTELTELKIKVRKTLKSELLNEKWSNMKNESVQNYETLPISKVPVLEEGESLITKFCADCKGRKLEDLGFGKMIVFFRKSGFRLRGFQKSR